MLADFFTKPLQGSLFRKFRAVLLGHAHVDTLSARPGPSSPEERVERQILAAITPDPNAIVSRSAAEPNSVSEPNSLPAYYRQTSTKIATVSALLVLTNTDKRVYRIHSDLRERLFCPTSVPPIVHACMHACALRRRSISSRLVRCSEMARKRRFHGFDLPRPIH
jgi:hypothetical protein